MMKWCSVTFPAVMFADCVVVWAAAAVLADLLLLFVAAAAVLAAVTVWNTVVGLPASAASAASVAVAACLLFRVSVDLLLSWCMQLSECLLKVLL